MSFFIKKPFHKSIVLSKELFNNLLLGLPEIDLIKVNSKNTIMGKDDFEELIIKNWDQGSYPLSKKEINKLSNNSSISLIKKKLIKWHHLRNINLSLKSSCIFYPAKCKYSFVIDSQRYIYHKYHLDSGYRIKVLIALEDGKNQTEQFSYIKKFPESIFNYYLKRHFYSKMIVFFHKILYYLSLKKIKLSGQPPELPLKYQNPKLYKKYSLLKKGEMISFHNLYPHSSHNGFSKHKSPMLQLVFDKC